MAKSKQKIKAQTLLKRVQTGVKTGTKNIFSSNFSYGNNITLFRKREIVKPYLHPYDSITINNNIDARIRRDPDCSKDPNIASNIKKFLPDHLINDIYGLYYNRSGKMELEPKNNTNSTKYKIIESINNSLVKVMTNGNHIGSYIFSEEISKYLYKKFMTLPPEEQKKLEEQLKNTNQGEEGEDNNEKQNGSQSSKSNGDKEDKNSGEGDKNNKSLDKDGQPNSSKKDKNNQNSSDSDPNSKNISKTGSSAKGNANNSNGNNSKKDFSQNAVDEMINNLLNSTSGKKDFENAIKKAEEQVEKLREAGIDFDNTNDLPEEEQLEIIQNLSNLDYLRGILKKLNTSRDKILKAIEKILSKTNNYFSKKCITKDVELFDCEELLDINGLELLHPIFKKSRIFDINITERKYIGKIDLYVDCSGSMSGGCGGDLSSVQRIELAKSLALQMKEMGILGNLYEFEDRPKKIKNTEISILMMAAGGGTNIEYVLRKIISEGNNAIVLTDGESHVSTYTHQVFFIGVGTDFSYFAGRGNKNTPFDQLATGEKFVANNQCLMYNGKDFIVRN